MREQRDSGPPGGMPSSVAHRTLGWTGRIGILGLAVAGPAAVGVWIRLAEHRGAV